MTRASAERGARLPTLIYCADGNKRYAEIAIRHGFAYGAQLPNTVYFPPVFVDQNWRAPVRDKYMAALAVHRPTWATVLDWERDDQRDEILSWATEAAQYVSEAVIIIPKTFSGIATLPREIGGKQVRLGYSVPTKFAGTEVPIWEFSGWPVHLLGGSPQEQMKLSKYLNVVSADGNYASKMASQHCAYFANGTARQARNRYWPKLNETQAHWVSSDVPYRAFELSCINIKAAWQGTTAAIRYASEEDLPNIIKIGRQFDRSLGFIPIPALREAMHRFELLVAYYGTQVVGFMHYHLRRDGWSTVYELAVHREYQKQRIGTALFKAIPGPIRLKCTTDNSANEFYGKQGLQLTRTEPGRKRPLNVWERAVA